MSRERDLDRRLKALPGRRAPRGLAARILAAAELSARPWHARPFWTWSAAGQAAFLCALAFAAAALAGTVNGPLSDFGALAQERLGWLQTLTGALARAVFAARAPLSAAAALCLSFCVLPTAALLALPRARSTEKP